MQYLKSHTFPDRVVDFLHLDGLKSHHKVVRHLTQSESYVLEDKYENGFETWDANTDIAKLNFVFSHADTKRLENLPRHDREYQTKKIKAKNFEAQDYVVNSGKYWTRKTNDIFAK